MRPLIRIIPIIFVFGTCLHCSVPNRGDRFIPGTTERIPAKFFESEFEGPGGTSKVPTRGVRNFADGIVTSTVGSNSDVVRALALSRTGDRIIVAGRTSNGGTDDDFLVGRIFPDGSPDAEFDSDGFQTTDFSANRNDVAHAVGIQTDGQIILGGRTNSGSNFDLGLVRYRTNGSLDTSFGSSGKQTHTVGSGSDFLRGLYIQTDGMIAVTGYTMNGSQYDYVTMRLLNSGGVDTSFNSGNMQIHDITTGRDDCATSVFTTTNGRITVAGATYNASNNWDIAVARYMTNGAVDSSAFSSGKLISSRTGDAVIWAIAGQTDGKIVGVGEAQNTANASSQDFLTVRYTDSALDTAFAGVADGHKVNGTNNTDIARSVKIMTDGTIFSAGESNNDVAIMKLTGAGVTTGITTHTIGSNTEVANAVSVFANNSVFAAGRTNNGSNEDIFVSRYNVDKTLAPSGTFDLSFGGSGYVIHTYVGTSIDAGFGAVALNSTGRIFAAGWNGTNDTTIGGGAVAFLTRFDESGVYDTAFGQPYVGGISAHSILVQTDGKLNVIAPGQDSGAMGFYATNVNRYLANGVMDTTWANNGTLMIQYEEGVNSNQYTGKRTAITSDGRIIVAGEMNDGEYKIALMSATQAGVYQDTYSHDGAGSFEEGWDVVITSDGKFIVGGTGSTAGGTGYDFKLAKFFSNGVLDTTFATSGVNTHTIRNAEKIYGLAIQSDQKILAAGYAEVAASNNSNIVIARYTTNGVFDTTYGTGGYLLSTLTGTAHDQIWKIALQPNQKAVACGDRGSELFAARFTASGTFDTTFKSGQGWVATTAGTATHARDLALQSDGKIICAGHRDSSPQEGFLVRFWP